MSELRWILVFVGAAILGAIYYFGKRPRRPSSAKKQRNAPPAGVDEPTPDEMSRELQALGQLIADQRTGVDAAGGGSPDSAEDQEEAVQIRDHDKIVTLLITAAPGHHISGPALKIAADKAGLEFGALGIYHRMHEGAGGREPLLSLANLFQPGTLDLARPDLFQTQGLALFLTLPAPISALDAWDALLATGERLAGLLDAKLLDDGHSELSRQRLSHIREEMREYDRRSEIAS